MRKIKQCFWCRSSKLNIIAKRIDHKPVSECQSCGLLLVTELPDDLSEFYTDEAYFNPANETSTGYHENYNNISPLYLYWQGSLLNEVASNMSAKTLLEIGCATGNALEMIRLRNQRLKLTGIDLSPYAIEQTAQKGFEAKVSTINEFSKKGSKYDIVFTSETMEHVDDLIEFVEAAKKTMRGKDSAYVFYVPAVKKQELIKQGPKYISLTTSLEHVSYFTSNFLETALSKVFDNVALIQMSTDGEDYIMGVASKDPQLVNRMSSFFRGLKQINNDIKGGASLFNATVITAKFALFNIAETYLSKLSKLKDKTNSILGEGILSYNKGELEKAKLLFSQYNDLGNKYEGDFLLKLMFANEKDLNQIYRKQLDEMSITLKDQKDLEKRLMKAEGELADLRQSKIVGTSIKIRKGVGKTLDPIRRQKKKLIPRSKGLIIKVLPGPAKKTVLKISRRIKYKTVSVANKAIVKDAVLCSVVIPYYNRGATIEETLDSLRQQTFKGFETIIVDDGSHDSQSIEMLKSIEKSNKKITIIRQKNSGVSMARNNGIKLAKGKYILCLDSDDCLTPTCLEKMVLLLEANPDIKVATSDMYMFGVENKIYKQAEYDPKSLMSNNMVITAAMFEKKAWEEVGGYTPEIGYEDWEFWIKLAEKGYWGKRIPEALFKYRTAISSRYIDDKSKHRQNLHAIKQLHPMYSKRVNRLLKKTRRTKFVAKSDSVMVNLVDPNLYVKGDKPGVLILIPWMTFGGAETLVNNFCKEICGDFEISYMTGLSSDNEWEYKFQEITNNIYHLANITDNKDIQLEIISNYIKTREIKILHVIHNGFVFKMLPELKKRHRNLKVVVTMFNDRVDYFKVSTEYSEYIDTYTSDNNKVNDHYKKIIGNNKNTVCIPNGIDSDNIFNPKLYDRYSLRENLGLNENDIVCIFVGRLSVEKNPNIFVDVAARFSSNSKFSNLKFIIIGDGPMSKEIKKSIKSIKNITHIGYKPEVADYLNAADIFVLPSAIEGFPLSLLEAMAMNLVSIASDVGAVSEVLVNERTGFVVKPGSTSEIVEAIKKIHQNPNLLKTMGSAARRDVDLKYSSKKLGINYTKLYKEI